MDGDIAGTFHSKVRCSAMGLGNVSTTLDPNWRGKLLFSLNNPTKRKIKLVIEEKNDGDRKAVGLITMVLYRIAGKERTHHQPKNYIWTIHLCGLIYGRI